MSVASLPPKTNINKYSYQDPKVKY